MESLLLQDVERKYIGINGSTLKEINVQGWSSCMLLKGC